MITTNDILVDPLTELFHRKELCDNAMSCLPVGRLASSEKNGQLYYEGFVDGQRFTLKRDDPRITAFSDRHLVAATQKAISRKIHSLERGKIEPIVFDPNLLLPSISRVYQHPSTEIFRAMGFQDARNWATAPYEKNENHPESLIIRSKQGTLVRSRIEAGLMDIYADLYDEFGVLIRYEPAFVTPFGTVIFPDFCLFVPGLLRLLLHEHFGKMDDPDYAGNNFLWKHHLYIHAGLTPFTDILYTFEGPGGSLDYPFLKEQIRSFILRNLTF